MNTSPIRTTESRRSSLVGKLAASFAGLMLCAAPILAADIPDAPQIAPAGPSGYYKVASTNDPIFPGENREYFLDFGKGLAGGKTSGTVAVSMRQNPNVRTRILVWQFFPSTGNLVIGYQTAEGSRQAVTLATWKATRSSAGLVLRRGDYQMVINRASEGD